MADPDPAVLLEVAALVALVTGRPERDVRAADRFVDDLGVDSLAMVRLLEQCRSRLGVAVPTEATRQLVHVGDLADLVFWTRRRT